MENDMQYTFNYVTKLDSYESSCHRYSKLATKLACLAGVKRTDIKQYILDKRNKGNRFKFIASS